MTIKRALISVSDKNGLATFAAGLSELGVELISTSGTAQLLSDSAPLKPQRVIHELNRRLPSPSIVISDAGSAKS